MADRERAPSATTPAEEGSGPRVVDEERERGRAALRAFTAGLPRREMTAHERRVWEDFRRREAAGEIEWLSDEEQKRLRVASR